MAFIYSKLSDEEKLFLQSYNLQEPIKKGMKVGLYDQVYDEERNIRFVLASHGIFPTGYRERPMVFALIWNDYVCSVSTYYDIEKRNDDEDSVAIKWDFWRIYAPKALEMKKKEILSLIQEALKTYKLYNYNIVETSFINIPEIRFIENKEKEKYYYGV